LKLKLKLKKNVTKDKITKMYSKIKMKNENVKILIHIIEYEEC